MILIQFIFIKKLQKFEYFDNCNCHEDHFLTINNLPQNLKKIIHYTNSTITIDKKYTKTKIDDRSSQYDILD